MFTENEYHVSKLCARCNKMKEISKNITILTKLEATGMSLEAPPSTMEEVGKGGGK